MSDVMTKDEIIDAMSECNFAGITADTYVPISWVVLKNAIAALSQPEGEAVAWMLQSVDRQGRAYTDISPVKPSDGMMKAIRQDFEETKLTPLFPRPATGLRLSDEDWFHLYTQMNHEWMLDESMPSAKRIADAARQWLAEREKKNAAI